MNGVISGEVSRRKEFDQGVFIGESLAVCCKEVVVGEEVVGDINGPQKADPNPETHQKNTLPTACSHDGCAG